MREHPAAEALVQVARRLGDLAGQVVFVGGAALLFLLPVSAGHTVRPTDDVDLVVPVQTTLAYYQWSDRLRALGFAECTQAGAPLCRWVVDDIPVDVMPAGVEALGFSNRWYAAVLADPLRIEPEPGLIVQVASVPAFLATKFEAFAGRGEGDYVGDVDLEDIVTLLAYRGDVADLVHKAVTPVREYLRAQMRQLLARKDVADIVSGCLPADPVSQALVGRVLDTLETVASS